MAISDGPPPIGERMIDGSIYAGISPETGKPMYVTSESALRDTFNDGPPSINHQNNKKSESSDNKPLPSLNLAAPEFL